MKYSIVFDTNKLYNSFDNGGYSEIGLNSIFKNVVDEIEKLNLTNTVEILLPEFVLEELKKQYIDKFYNNLKADIDRIKNKKYPILSLKIDGQENLDVKLEQIESIADDKFKKYKKTLKKYSVNIEMISVSENTETFRRIIQRAFEKNPPFGNPNGKGDSDKGFKDVLIWESAIEYKKKNSEVTIVIYSGDGILKHEYLEKEYKLIFNDGLRKCGTEEEMKIFLKNIPEEEKDSSDIEKGSVTYSEDYSILKNVFDNKEFKLLIIEELEGHIMDGFIEDIECLDIDDINEVDFQPSELNQYTELARKYSAKLQVILNVSNESSIFKNFIELEVISIIDKEFKDKRNVFGNVEVERIEVIKNG
ncbi:MULTISPECIES: PIN domain-containing protein [unclassified Enterococcus]|uniref:PIN domain-containing protein n=1 Tax=unclassified Enterococcus TaxID=2608891 RepID=UPI003F227166